MRPTALEFPCQFPIKAFGHAESGFDCLVVEIVRRHAPDLGENAVRSRRSRNDRFESVTVTVPATSQEQLDAIYRELSAREEILLVL